MAGVNSVFLRVWSGVSRLVPTLEAIVADHSPQALVGRSPERGARHARKQRGDTGRQQAKASKPGEPSTPDTSGTMVNHRLRALPLIKKPTYALSDVMAGWGKPGEKDAKGRGRGHGRANPHRTANC